MEIRIFYKKVALAGNLYCHKQIGFGVLVIEQRRGGRDWQEMNLQGGWFRPQNFRRASEKQNE
jgi:hypothetical protein